MESARTHGLSPGPWFWGRRRRSGTAGGPPLSRTVLPGWLSCPPRSLYKVSRFRRAATLSSWAPEKSRGLGVRCICEPSHLDMTGRGWKFHSDPGRHRTFTGVSCVRSVRPGLSALSAIHLPFRPLSGRRPASASGEGAECPLLGRICPISNPEHSSYWLNKYGTGAATLRSGWRIELPCSDEFLAFLPLPS
jgi:hypothetical protein